MKKFTVIFLTLAIILSLLLGLTAYAAEDTPGILSGYYGIDRNNGLIGQISPGTEEAALFSRILPLGDLQLSSGVSTGSVLSLSQSGTVLDTLTLVVLSDCNGDGGFSISDMLTVQSFLLSQIQFSPAQAQAADVSGDNTVTITDFLQMKSKLLGLSDFSCRFVADAENCASRILAPGEICSFGPEDGILASDLPMPMSEPTSEPSTEPSTEAADPSTEATAPSAEATDPSTEATDPSTEATEPSTQPPTEPPKVVDLEGDAVTWSAGTVTAVREGTARVTYENETLIITVCQEGLTLSLPQNTLFVGPGASTQLQSCTNHPVQPGSVHYTVADTSVASVDAKGVLTGIASGVTTVTASLPGGQSATQEVRVIELIDTLGFDTERIKVKNGGTKQLLPSFSPSTSPEELIWTSSDTGIATVDGSGVVTGIANGTVTITCTTKYGNLSASYTVKVCDLIQVALTYDDGPSSSYTPKLLDLLQQYNIKATFFLVGNRIYTTPNSIKRMADEGHEIGYHTWAHSYVFNMTADEMRADLETFQNAVMAASGKTATVFRAPGGNITDKALQTIGLPHILWSQDTFDWQVLETESVKNGILKGLWDGCIILMHDLYGSTYRGTAKALEYIFANDLDVEFLTVTELLSRNGTPPQPGVSYRRG